MLPSAILASSGSAVDAAIRESGGEVRAPGSGLRTLDHQIFIVQENRSFDHYFGTYPGADGFTMVDGDVSVGRARAPRWRGRSREAGVGGGRARQRGPSTRSTVAWSVGGVARLTIRDGRIALGSLDCPGFAVAAEPDWAAMQPVPL